MTNFTRDALDRDTLYPVGYSSTLKGALGSFRMRQPLPCGSENLDIIIAEGGDITARNKLGRTALHYASQAGRVRTVRRLLDLLGREEVDIDGWIPLCRALRGTESLVDEIRAGEAANTTETMRILIKRGANR